MSLIKENYLYSTTHEWVRKISETVVLVGITDYAQHALGDVVYVSDTETNKNFKQGEQLGAIDSVKVSAELYTPVSGKTLEFNSELIGAPELLNSDPYEKGWIVKIELSNPSELGGLLSPEAYKELVDKVDAH